MVDQILLAGVFVGLSALQELQIEPPCLPVLNRIPDVQQCLENLMEGGRALYLTSRKHQRQQLLCYLLTLP